MIRARRGVQTGGLVGKLTVTSSAIGSHLPKVGENAAQADGSSAAGRGSAQLPAGLSGLRHTTRGADLGLSHAELFADRPEVAFGDRAPAKDGKRQIPWVLYRSVTFY